MFIKLSVALLCLFFLHGFSLGDVQARSTSGSVRFEVTPYLSSIAYDEPGVMKESGEMHGVAASVYRYKKCPAGFDMIRLDLLAGRGSVDYSSDSFGSICGIDNTMIESRALLGKDLYSTGNTVISSFSGFGYRRLTDKSEGLTSSVGCVGYHRKSQYFYMPLGIGINSNLQRGWRFEGTVEYDVFARGIQQSAMTEANNAYYTYSNDISNDQNKGYGIRLSASFQKRISEGTAIAIKPFFRYWSIGTSKEDELIRTDSSGHSEHLYVWEPKNSSSEYGVGMSVIF
jgi:hypothetical protein